MPWVRQVAEMSRSVFSGASVHTEC